MSREIFIGNDRIITSFETKLTALSKGKGAIMVVTGETGFGKTTVINHIADSLANNPNVLYSATRAASPIGRIKVGNMQPLLPFTKAFEGLSNDSEEKAKKKFMVNVGMTLLTAIPFAGDAFYAAKEISKDWRELQKDKSALAARRVSSAAGEFYDVIRAQCDKSPVVMLIDDMQWADAQSVELMNLLAETISGFPLLIVMTVKPSILESAALPIINFFSNARKLTSVEVEALDTFDFASISRAAGAIFDRYLGDQAFERYIFERTGGVPVSVMEYIKYFANNSPFDANGNFSEAYVNRQVLPASIQALVSESLEGLSEEDRTILGICSAEGMEFTVTVVSKLLNLDVLTTIKKLKSIASRTNIIKSTGASIRYGEKTTAYKFTQAFYQTYFERSLEYEEYQSLHQTISGILKAKYDSAKAESIREELAPYIAAHSVEAGDADTAETMLLVSAEGAKKYGNPDVIQELYSNYKMLKPSSTEEKQDEERIQRIISETEMDYSFRMGATSGTTEVSGVTIGNVNQPEPRANVLNINDQINIITSYYAEGDTNSALTRIRDIQDGYKEVLTAAEILKIALMEAKITLDIGDINASEKLITKIEEEIESIEDKEIKCFYYNVKSLHQAAISNSAQANYFLQLAAESAVGLSAEMRLLTISNIAMLMGEQSSPNAEKYLKTAKKLAVDLNMPSISAEIDSLIKKKSKR